MKFRGSNGKHLTVDVLSVIFKLFEKIFCKKIISFMANSLQFWEKFQCSSFWILTVDGGSF